MRKAYYYDGGYVPVPGKDYDNSSLHVPYSNDNDYSDATTMSFGDHPARYTVAYILQYLQTARAWVKFIPDVSEGFTDIGIEESTTLRKFTLYQGLKLKQRLEFSRHNFKTFLMQASILR